MSEKEPEIQKEMLRTRLRQQGVVAELGLFALSGATLRELMDEAVNNLRDVLHVEYAKVLELLPGGKEVILRAGKGWNQNIVVDKSTVDTGSNSQAGFTLLSKEPVVVEDLRTDKRFNGPALLNDHGVISGMSCIIWGKGQNPYGVLGIHTIKKRLFTRHDINFLQAVANILAAAIQREEDELLLNESEVRKVAILEASRDAIISIDHQGMIVEWNASAERLFGYSQEKVLGKHMAELIIPKRFRKDHEQGMSHYLATGEGPVLDKLLEVSALRADGTEFISELTITRVPVEGKPPMFSAAMRDITDRKQTEASLSESEARFRMLADNIPNLCWMARADGSVYWYNSRWYGYTGTVPEDMAGWGWQSVHDPDILPLVLEKWKTSIRHAEPFEMIFPLKGADGKFRPFLTRVVPVRNEEKNILEWFGTNTDITAIREVEAQLQYQKSLLQAQQNVSPLGILVVSPKGNIEIFNKRFARMWNLPNEVLDSQLDPFALESVRGQIVNSETFINNILECYSKRAPNEEKLFLKDGRIFYRYGSPINGEDGMYYGYVWFFQDITEQENMVRQKDDFISIASHELKTPLTSIKGSVQVMEHLIEAGNYEQLHNFVKKTHQHVNKLSILINDLLDVSRIQSGKIEYNFSWFKLREIIEDSVEQVMAQSQRHKISVEGDRDVMVYGDKIRLEQVIINLLSNAVKYSPDADQVKIRVSEAEGQLELSVTDFGIGVNKDDLCNLFNRFYRSKQFSQQFTGFGLGLYISKEIIERHGGKITVESPGIGKGTTFKLTIPAGNKTKAKGRSNNFDNEQEGRA